MDSKHLLIRKTSFDDCQSFFKWETSTHVTSFLCIDDDRSFEEIVREMIENESDPTMIQLTILLKETNSPIGRIIISKINTHYDSLDITKIYIGEIEEQRKGYGEEAMRLVLEYCFMNLHTERVTLDHFPGNAAAAALYMKLGFQYEGIARNACKKNGKYVDLNLMSMLRAEYYEKVHMR